MNKITVKNFANGYEKCVSDDEKRRYFKSNLEITPYISYAEKDNIAKNIIKATTHAPEESDAAGMKRAYFVNSAAKNMIFKLFIIKTWTNIDVDMAHCVEEYDGLAQNGLLSAIISKVPAEEVGEFAALVEWAKDDFLMNELSTEAFVQGQVQKIVGGIKAIAEPMMDRFIETIQTMDENKVKKSLGAIDAWVKTKSKKG